MEKKIIVLIGNINKLEDEINKFFENNKIMDENTIVGQVPVTFDFIVENIEEDREIPIENSFYKGISRVRKNEIYKQKSRLYNYRKK